jgi:mannan endo-1,4-beta-mannosidase
MQQNGTVRAQGSAAQRLELGWLAGGRLRQGATAAFCAVAMAGCLRFKQPQTSSSPPANYIQPKEKEFVVRETNRPSAYFLLDGKPFCFAGTNNYYLTFKSHKMADDVLEKAKAMGLKVIRIWGFIDRGSLDGSVPDLKDSSKDGCYFQYWDTAQKRPGYNDGDNGLKRLDYVLSKARSLDLKIMPVLTNNWPDFGGMDQYLLWYGLTKHHEFYTNPQVKQAFKDWIAHLIQRKNSIDGTPYSEDPAIFGWELANEPRIRNYTKYDSPEGWDGNTITQWAGEMAAYIKSLDPNHLTSVGDEGFFAQGKKHWTYSGDQGVDHRALLALPAIDFGTFHLYPDTWGTGYAWANDWIDDHIKAAQELGKPTMLEEYGAVIRRSPDDPNKITYGLDKRMNAYRLWNEIIIKSGGNASLNWMLAGHDDDRGRYPDFDGFTFYSDEATGKLIAEYAATIQTDARACRFAQSDPTLKAQPVSKFVRVRPPPALTGGS